MSADSERLLSVARALVDRCPGDLGGEIAVGGSIGAGVADAYSDVELLVLEEPVPPVERIRAWVESVGTDAVVADEDGEASAWFVFEGVEIDAWWGRLGKARAEAEAVASGDVADTRRLALGHVLPNLVPLRTRGALDELARTVVAYPDGLARRLIEDALRWWKVPAPRVGTAIRGDAMAARTYIVDDARHVLRIVFALNERWELPHWKWLRHHAAMLTIAPPELVDRLDAALLEPDLVVSLRRMTELARDTVALVPGHIDTGAARHAFDVRLHAIAATVGTA